MADLMVNIVLAVLAVSAAFLAFQRRQKKKSIWYVLSIVASLLAALAFWFSRVNGFFLLFLAVALFLMGGLFKKR